MEAGVINSKQLDEFQAEIDVLSKVRHRHLVSLFGHATEGNERLLVYDFLPEGALSKHLFHWKSMKTEPLSWKKRLSIALDVARGMEYLHALGQQSFIHRDLKSSNILLDEEYRSKVSDFGLVKLAPDKEKFVATRLAGTFGFLSPEYAVTGKITTKVDVLSYEVVLMELLTGLVALDEDRSEESRYLAEWFWRIKSNRETLIAAIDPALNIKEELYESITTIADLAGHCTARDPNHRPDMGHAVSVLSHLSTNRSRILMKPKIIQALNTVNLSRRCCKDGKRKKSKAMIIVIVQALIIAGEVYLLNLLVSQTPSHPLMADEF